VLGDPLRLRQVLLNLLINALKFTPHGEICVALRRMDSSDDPDCLYFEVKDSGIGIPPEKQHLLFQDFAQLDTSTSRQYGGSGLGLAICQRLVHKMHGTIGLMSAPERGSTFWFTAALPATQSPRTVKREVAPGHSLRILVVDDNELNGIMVEAMLKHDGHDVVVVSNGVRAVSAVQAERFDLVLMDMQMPVMDGMDATRAIRHLSGPAKDIPIIALTANAMTEDVRNCRAAGMNDHLAKPLERELLRQALLTWGGERATAGASR
jgi:CheY-like chemotaxis protein